MAALLEMAKVSGTTPKALLDQPKIEPHLRGYQKVYDRLSRARQWNDGSPQPIALSEILAYCDGLGLVEIEFRENLIDLIQEMDEEFIDHILAQRAADTRAKSDVVGP